MPQGRARRGGCHRPSRSWQKHRARLQCSAMKICRNIWQWIQNRNPRHLNIIGLACGLTGVVIIFIWGPPQPNMEPGMSLGLSGPMVADHDRAMSARRLKHKILSRVGLAFIWMAFACQLWAVLVGDAPAKVANCEQGHAKVTSEEDANRPRAGQDRESPA